MFNTRTGTVKLFSVTSIPGAPDDVQFATNDRNGNVWLLNNRELYASIPDQYILQRTNIEQQITKDYLPN
ncbi:MAG: hypothetical protein QM763_22595 [Agriterribacter sp.]